MGIIYNVDKSSNYFRFLATTKEGKQLLTKSSDQTSKLITVATVGYKGYNFAEIS